MRCGALEADAEADVCGVTNAAAHREFIDGGDGEEVDGCAPAGDASDWMRGLPDCLPFAEVTMPGTHNSASYAFGAGHLAAVLAASRCQSADLDAQLRMGVRFLDLRARPGGGLCHGRVACALSLREALGTCGAFLQRHPSEVLLVRIKDEAGGRTSARGVGSLVWTLAESAEYPLYLQRRLPSSLGEVRGRIVLLCDWGGGQLGLRWAGEAMRIQDEYWQSSSAEKWQVVFQHFARTAPEAKVLQVHFTSATNLPRKMPLDIARGVNPRLARYLRRSPRRCASQRSRFVGIVAMDFPTQALCRLVLRLNWFALDPCRALDASLQSTPGLHGWLDNLQCELLAAASRADVALRRHEGPGAGEEREERERRDTSLLWLSKIYAKLLLERAGAELLEASVEEPRAEKGQREGGLNAHDHAGPRSTTHNGHHGGHHAHHQRPDVQVQAPARPAKPAKQVGLLWRSVARCVGPRPALDAPLLLEVGISPSLLVQRSAATPAFATEEEEEELFAAPPPNEAFLLELERELAAAAARADAALDIEIAKSAAPTRTPRVGGACGELGGVGEAEELRGHVRWLARVYVRIAVERARMLSSRGAEEPQDDQPGDTTDYED